MKIICIAHNYSRHNKELNSPTPEVPVFFMKPDSALLLNNAPFFLPDFSLNLHHEIEIVIKINRLGRHIDNKFAHRYYEEIGLGIDFTARDLQYKCKENGEPWEIAKAFDGSAPVSNFISLNSLPEKDAINFQLKINDELRQTGNSRDMLFKIDDIIEYVSNFVTLKIGDLIFTGTPEGVGPVNIGDHLEGFLEGEKMLDFYVK